MEIGKKWMDPNVFWKSTTGFGNGLVIGHWTERRVKNDLWVPSHNQVKGSHSLSQPKGCQKGTGIRREVMDSGYISGVCLSCL